jgi:hypothetical protein
MHASLYLVMEFVEQITHSCMTMGNMTCTSRVDEIIMGRKVAILRWDETYP